MGPGRSIYHWGEVTWEPAGAAYTHVGRTQKGIPIFKLICPDGTGGSKETIVSNPVVRSYKMVGPQGMQWKMERSSKIGETNQQVLVLDRVETKMKYQGSYNFAETAVMGLDEHKKNDVDPHKKDAIYIDPPDRFEPLADRIFFDYVLMRSGAIEPKKPKK